VTVRTQVHYQHPAPKSSLGGTVLKYIDATQPVAEDDWEALR
jgi:hypothetical protein